MKKLIYLLFLIIIVLFSGCITAKDHSKKGLPVKYVTKINMISSFKTDNVKLIVLLLKDYECRQKIIDESFSIELIRIFEDMDNRYAEFFFKKIIEEKIEIIITQSIEVFSYDVYSAQILGPSLMKRNKRIFNNDELNKYLQTEKYIESDNELIKETAAKFGSIEDKFELVNEIYRYVNKKIWYGIQKANMGALYALKVHTGDCSEFAYLFVALCRARGIPARYVDGFCGKIGHAWAEVYFDKYGWVPYDPTSGIQIIDQMLKSRNYYIYLNFKANDNILNREFNIANSWSDGAEPGVYASVYLTYQ